MRKIFGNLLRLAGYQAVPRDMMKTYGALGHVRHLHKLVNELQIDCVFDVGANKGQFRDLLRNEVGFKGTIISFEPLPDLQAYLMERSKADPCWEVVNCALGREVGTLPMNVTEGSDLSSLRNPSNDINWSAKDRLAVRDVIDVPVNRLDEQFEVLRKAHGFQSPLLKLDTQGYDLEALHGAGKSLNYFLAVQTELAFVPLYDDMPLYSEVVAFLEERAFVTSGIYPISLDHTYRLIEADGLFVNAG